MSSDFSRSAQPTLTRAGARARRAQRRRRRSLKVLAVAATLIVAVTVWLTISTHTKSAAQTDRGNKSTSTTTTIPAFHPTNVTPLINPPLRGEGRWSPKDLWHAGAVRVETTFYRSDPSNPSTLAYVSWIRSSSTRLGLYLGYEGPGPTSLHRGPEQVPTLGRWNLLATFNSGFYEKDSPEGFYTHGVLYFPMINGRATIVEYSNGTLDIVNWHNGSHVPSNVIMARQNLHLLVNNAKVTPGTANNASWGLTLHGVPAVWRTAIGVDAQGNLLYVAAPNQTAISLARILVHVGAVRAMQLDINPEWPIFVTYGGPNASSPHLNVPNPNQIANRFLYTSTKDFFAVYARVHGKIETPW